MDVSAAIQPPVDVSAAVQPPSRSSAAPSLSENSSTLTRRYNLKSRRNYPLMIALNQKPKPDEKHPLPPLASRELILTKEQYDYLRGRYHGDILISMVQ